MENDIYIAKKRISTENFLLKLNRQAHQLEVYQKSRWAGSAEELQHPKGFCPV